MGDTNAVRGDARAATNDASTGVQAQLPAVAPCAAATRAREPKLRRCVAGITPKSPQVVISQPRFWSVIRVGQGTGPCLYSPSRNSSEAVRG